MPDIPTLNTDLFPESALIDHPGVHYHKRIMRQDVDLERAAYVDAAVARCLLKRMSVRRADDLKESS